MTGAEADVDWARWGRRVWAAGAMLAVAGCPSAPERRGGGSVVEIEYLEPLDPETSTVSHSTVPAAPEGTPEALESSLDQGSEANPPAHPPSQRSSVTFPGQSEENSGSEALSHSGISTVAFLPGTHPAMRKAAAELVRRLAAEGIAVKLIFGYTPYSPRKRTGPGGWASWHEFGLAFDLNLTHRKSLGDAKKHFVDDDATWRRIGAVAAEVGLVWGGSWRTTYDPFHFEWHPGHDSVINKDDLRQLLKLAGKRGKNYQRTWGLFDSL